MYLLNSGWGANLLDGSLESASSAAKTTTPAGSSPAGVAG